MNKLRFITIGFVEYHKGQDILIDAIKKMDESLLEHCIFLLVGNKSSLFAKSLETQIEKIPFVEMIGMVNRREIHKLIATSDVLVCPSREDSMPTVCAEAMMHKVPCIVSNATGTAAYIIDGHDGLIFKNEDIDDLKEKIIWCIKNQDNLPEIGNRAFDIYQRFFSMDAFEKNLLKYVQEMI